MPVKKGQLGRVGDFQSIGDFVAFEDITAGQPVAIIGPQGVEYVTLSYLGTDTQYGGTGGQWKAQKFVTAAGSTKIAKITVQVNEDNGGGNEELTFAIRSSLTGADLWTGTVQNYASIKTHTFTVNLATTGNETFYLIAKIDNNTYWRAASTETYVAGETFSSTDSGVSWGSAESDRTYYFKVEEATEAPFEVCLAGADYLGTRLNFVGFAIEDATAGNPVKIDMQKFVVLSGLTADETYYLSDTAGALSTTPGTYERVVGRATSTTRLIRKFGVVSPHIAMPTVAPAPCLVSNGGAGSNTVISVDGSAHDYNGSATAIADVGDSLGGQLGPKIRLLDFGSLI